MVFCVFLPKIPADSLFLNMSSCIRFSRTYFVSCCFCRDNVLSDCFQGCFIVTCTLCTFISLVWLREQIMHGGGPEWLDVDQQAAENLARPVCMGVA